MVKLTFCILLLLALILRTSEGVNLDSERKVWLKTGIIHVAKERQANFPKLNRRALSGARDCLSEAASLRQYIITLKDGVSEKSHEEITRTFRGEGVISSYLPDHSYLVFANPEAVEKTKRLSTWIGHFQSKHKVSSDFVLEHSGIQASESTNRSFAPVAQKVWFSVHLPQNILQLKMRSCSGVDASTALVRNLCSKAKAQILDSGEKDGTDESLICEKVSSNRITFGVEKRKAGQFISWVIEQPEVHSIDRARQLELHNFHANAIMQCGKAADVDFESSEYQQEYLPAWHAGFRGENQVVGVSDSGLAHNSCFFKDENEPLSFSERDAYGRKVFYSTSHRKIDMYRCLNDCKDHSGHGTHVSGTLVGESSSSTYSSKYDGVAPKAKIAFTDLGKSILNIMQTPSLSEDLFPNSYARGVKIHSDSWGASSDDATYDSLAQEADDFTWKHQDFLSFFPAGNDGASNYFYTLTSPAVAKNVVAVGATMNYKKDTKVYLASGISQIKISGSPYFDVMQTSAFNTLEAQFGGDDAYADVKGNTYELVSANPLKACSELENAEELAGKVAVIKRGQCMFTVKVRNAQNAGAKAVLIYNNKNKGYYYMGASKKDKAEDVSIPSYAISLRYGEQIMNAFGGGRSMKIVFEGAASDPPTFETLAEYSSVGPTFDDRIKPDIVAPGDLISAGSLSSLHTCYTVERSGTSMAVPVVSGAAILTRQYFTEGRFQIDGVSKFTNPSGPLIKALLLNGAKDMLGYSETGYPMDAVPSFEQGFGRVLLKDTLPLDSSFKLFIEDQVPISSGDVHSYCIETSSEGPLQVTLTWYDPPSDLLATKALVNDLDLKIHSIPQNFDFLGNDVSKEDRVNTVEQVKLKRAGMGKYIIEVKAHRIAQAGQKYSLVASGDFMYSDSRCSKTKFARIISKPELRSNVKEASFKIDVFDSVKQIEANSYSEEIDCKLYDCQHDDSTQDTAKGYHNWKKCGKEVKYTDLSDGYHCFAVRYNDDASPTSISDDLYGFHIKTVSPKSKISKFPDAISGKREATISFSSTDDSSVSFKCQLLKDGNPLKAWESCASPKTYSNLDDGDYKFIVKGKDEYGNEEIAGADASWTIDTKGPKTTILSFPSVTNKSKIEVEFTSPEIGSPNFGGYQCGFAPFSNLHTTSLDLLFENKWTDCTSPHKIKSLTDGLYIFGVRSYDSIGNYDESPEYRYFEVDTNPPTVQIVGSPPTQTNAASLIYRFVASEGNATTQCHFGQVQQKDDWKSCFSPKWYVNVEEGLHKFKVRARDEASNIGDFVESYVHVDRSPPQINVTTEVVYGAYGETTLNITIDIDDGPGSGVGYASCRLKKRIDGMSYQVIPETATTSCADIKRLAPYVNDGVYYFEVTAQDNVGNSVFYKSDPIVIDTVPPVIGNGGISESDDDKIVFTFFDVASNGENQSDVSYYKCTLKEVVTRIYDKIVEESSECSSPYTLEDLLPGKYKLEVQAFDESGNPSNVVKRNFEVKNPNEVAEGTQTSKKFKADMWMLIAFGSFILVGSVLLVFSYTQCRKHKQRKKQHAVAAHVVGIPVQNFERTGTFSPSAPPAIDEVSCTPNMQMSPTHDDASCTPVLELSSTNW